MKTCKRCGRKLKSPLSQELGFGTVCYKRHLNDINNPSRLFDMVESGVNNEQRAKKKSGNKRKAQDT